MTFKISERIINFFSILNKYHLSSALYAKLKDGYSRHDFYSDILAGTIVALIAIPLAMALAIASGAHPQNGLYTAIIAGFFVALFGGSRLQVSGPTAAFVVILYPIVQKFGLGGLMLAGFLAGIMLILMGYAKIGRLIQFIPYPVTTGFTSGIALVIAVLQLKDFFGLQISSLPVEFFDKIAVIFKSFGTFSIQESSVGAITLIILFLWPKISKRIPAPLAALSLTTVGCLIISSLDSSFAVETIGSRFAPGIPQSLPDLHWPWFSFSLSIENIQLILPSAFAIALLCAIESLLSAVVADGMAQTKHDPDGELIALGIGNILCPFFGGIPASGAISRTTTNIRFGAKSPVAGMVQALIALLSILILAPYISLLPMAALSALLILVAYNIFEYRHFTHILRVAPRNDVIVLLSCFFLTVVFDMVVGVAVGVVLAALLFMRRMAELTEGHQVTSAKELNLQQFEIPSNVIVYEIEGPLFFGAAEKAAGALSKVADDAVSIIFVMYKVSSMDITGMVALESAMNKFLLKGKKIYLVGLRSQPKELIKKSIEKYNNNSVIICDDITTALNQIKPFPQHG